jgi:hypothetical protein
MKVWIVMRGEHFEEGDIEGVYATKAHALAFLGLKVSDAESTGTSYRWDLGSEWVTLEHHSVK